MDLLIIFITGLTTGGLSCLAMQGGLLASVIVNQKDSERDELKNSPGIDDLDWQPVLVFVTSKLLAHTVLGFLLGMLGSFFSLSLGSRLVFQGLTSLFMFATAMNLLNVHPLFRFVVFQPPKFFQRLVRNSSKSKAFFAPALLGMMTVFIPCGVTQAMEVLAISSGNPFYAAAIMFTFVLGTTPLFILLGITTAKLSEGWYQKFVKLAAILLIGMAIYGFNGMLVVMDSPITVNRLVRPVTDFFTVVFVGESPATSSAMVGNAQEVTISINNSGYQPKHIKVNSGLPVNLTLISQDTYSCALSIVLKEFNISTTLKANDKKTFTFTPTKKGKYIFTCSMGMYSGTLEVI